MFAAANDLVVTAGGAPPDLLKVVGQGGAGATASAGVRLAAGPLTTESEALDTLLIAEGEGAKVATENPVLVRLGASARDPSAPRLTGSISPCWPSVFLPLHQWINNHLSDDLSLSVLADQAGMSERDLALTTGRQLSITGASECLGCIGGFSRGNDPIMLKF